MHCRKSVWTSFLVIAAGVFLLAAPAFAGAVEQRLAEMPAAIKDRTRAMIQKGVPGTEAIELVHALQANRFREEQIVMAQAVVLEAQAKGLPAKPVINKAFEGMAKQVPPDRILHAMGAVSHRYAFAYSQARSITPNTEEAGQLGNMLAESLAAGLKEQDASQLMSRLQEQSLKMDPARLNELAAACLAMARDMARLGVSSGLSSQVISSALSKGFNAAGIASMHQALAAQSQTHSAQELANGLLHGMQGQSSQGHGGMAGGQAGHGGQGGSEGSGGAAGGGGGGGGSGGGGSGGGAGGGGSGGGGSGGGGGGAGGGGGSGGGGSGGGGGGR